MKSIVRSICFVSSAGAVFLIAELCASSAVAAITPSGDTTLGTGFTNTYVGHNGSGSLDIDAGSSLTSSQSYVGYAAGATGTVTVEGTGSKWTSSGLNVGFIGSGTLNIEAEANVSDNTGYLGYFPGSTGTASVSGTGSTWTNNTRLVVGRDGTGALTVADGGLVTARTLYASPADLLGNGTISANGAILDADLVFDGTHGSTQTLAFGSGGSLNLTINGQGELGAGSQGVGTLRIAGGAIVNSGTGYLGAWAGSNGTATITGAGSKWITGPSVANTDLYVGSNGAGTLRIEAGGEVNTHDAYVADQVGSAGTITINGTGSKWTVGQEIYLGNRAAGAVSVEAGGRLNSSLVYLGNNAGSSGSVTVSGPGSTWDASFAIHVGYNGGGSLTVADGGSVTAKTFYGSTANLHGNGIITATGAVIDGNLIFDSTHGMTQALPFGTGGTLNLAFDPNPTLGAGYRGNGTFTVAEGKKVYSPFSYLAYHPGSTAVATVQGAGSEWNPGTLRLGRGGSATLVVSDGAKIEGSGSTWIGDLAGSSGAAIITGPGTSWRSSSLYVGYGGTGTLVVSNGAQVRSSPSQLGVLSGSVGSVTVRGEGTTWSPLTSINIGSAGKGTLSIEAGADVDTTEGYIGSNSSVPSSVVIKGAGSTFTFGNFFTVRRGTLTVADGGRFTSRALTVDSPSAARLHVSGDDMLVVSQTLTNNGIVAFYADALLPAGVYRPISGVDTWSGSGTYPAFGGDWNNTDKTFTVPAATSLSAGASDSVASGERLLFTDSATNRRVGVSFGTVTGSVSFSATPMAGDELDHLTALLNSSGQILDAWNFTTNNTGSGDVFLSFDVGPGFDDLSIWYLQGGAWQSYDPALLSYTASGLAGFTVNSFSGYAVTAAIPEPAAMALMVTVGAWFSLRRRDRVGR